MRMRHTAVLVLTLWFAHAPSQGNLMSGFLSFAELNNPDDNGTGFDTATDWDWPTFPTEDPISAFDSVTDLPIQPPTPVKESPQVLPGVQDVSQIEPPVLPKSDTGGNNAGQPIDTGSKAAVDAQRTGVDPPKDGKVDDSRANPSSPKDGPFDTNRHIALPNDPVVPILPTDNQPSNAQNIFGGNAGQTATDPTTWGNVIDNSGVVPPLPIDIGPPMDQVEPKVPTNVQPINSGGNPIDNSVAIPLPPFGSSTNFGTPNDPVRPNFLPSIPPGDEVVNLQTGDTKPFQPGVSWFGLDTALQTKAKKPTTEAPTTTIKVVIITPAPKSQFDNLPIVGGGMFVANQGQNMHGTVNVDQPFRGIPQVAPPKRTPGRQGGIETKPSAIVPAVKVNPTPIGKDAVLLGPAAGTPVDKIPQQTGVNRGNGKTNGIPNKWMMLYPDGRAPKQNAQVSVEAETMPALTPTELWMAQRSLNTFNRDREMSRRYRKERREKAKRLRRLRKQQRQQKKANGRRKTQKFQTKGPSVAKMVLPNTNIPFVGKNQRGRKLKTPCTRGRQRRGQCSPGT